MGLRYNKHYLGFLNGYDGGKPLVSVVDPCETDGLKIGFLNGYQDGKPLVSFADASASLQVGDTVLGFLNGYQDGLPLVSIFPINCSDPEEPPPPPPPPTHFISSCCDYTKLIYLPDELNLTCKYGTFKIRYKQVNYAGNNRNGWYSDCVQIGNFCFSYENKPYWIVKPYSGQFIFIPTTVACFAGFLTWTVGVGIGEGNYCPLHCHEATFNLGCIGAGIGGKNYSEIDPINSWPLNFDLQSSNCDTVYLFKKAQTAFIHCPQQYIFLPDDTFVVTP